jgi:exopolysaccharide production protein ExoZ
MAEQKIRSLQILRFAAAAMVVWMHAAPRAFTFAPGAPVWGGPHAELGAAGVDIFFVLSGAIIYQTAFAHRRLTGREFFRRRFLRVAPIYYLMTLAWLPFIGFADYAVSWQSAAASFSFWLAWPNIVAPAIITGWTLSFEMLFYASAATVLAWRPMLVVLCLAFGLSWWLRVTTGLAAFQLLGNPIVLEFAFGVAISALWKPKRPAPSWVGAFFIILGAAGIYAFCLPPGSGNAWFTLTGAISAPRVILWGVPSASILLGALAIEPHLKGRWLGPLVFMGDASYSIYLLHLPVLMIATGLAHSLGVSAPLAVVVPGFLALGIGSGTAVYCALERPMLKAIQASRSNTRESKAWAPQTSS